MTCAGWYQECEQGKEGSIGVGGEVAGKVCAAQLPAWNILDLGMQPWYFLAPASQRHWLRTLRLQVHGVHQCRAVSIFICLHIVAFIFASSRTCWGDTTVCYLLLHARNCFSCIQNRSNTVRSLGQNWPSSCWHFMMTYLICPPRSSQTSKHRNYFWLFLFWWWAAS